MAKQRTTRPQNKRICQVCGQPVVGKSEEHAYPKWLIERVRDEIKGTPAEEVWRQESKLVLRWVCGEACNGRMNHLFEEPARPILEQMLEHETVLSREDQAKVAGWCVKTAIVVALARDNVAKRTHLDPDARAFLESTLRGMLKDGHPPITCVVSVAHREPRAVPDLRPFDTPTPGETANLLVVILNIVCQVVLGLIPGSALQDHHRAQLRDDRFIVVWPDLAASVSWPPRPIACADVQRVRDRIGVANAHTNTMFGVRPERRSKG